MIVVLLRGQAGGKFSYHEAVVKVNQPRGVRKVRCDALQSLLCVSDESNIVRKGKVPDESLLGLGVDLEAP